MAEVSAALLSGEIETGVGLNRLASKLTRTGLHIEVRDSSHFKGSRYLRVYEGAHLTLERINAREYHASGDADSIDQMYNIAGRLSRALCDLGIRHRFEVSEARSDLAHYLHHLWPQAEGGSIRPSDGIV
jgi:hypothetical protein